VKDSKYYRFARRHYWGVTGLVVSFLAVIILSITMLADAVYFNDPRHRDESLKAWMTPRYVALSYDLPPPVVRELLGIALYHCERCFHRNAGGAVAVIDCCLNCRWISSSRRSCSCFPFFCGIRYLCARRSNRLQHREVCRAILAGVVKVARPDIANYY